MSKYQFDSEAFRAKHKQERIDNVYACIESAFVRFERFKKSAWTGKLDIFDLERRDNECDLVCYEQADFVSRQNNNPFLFIRNITKDMQYLKSYEA